MKSGNREKFVRLANKRVNSAIKSIQEVAKLSNRSLYDYTEKDVELIFHALQRELDACKNMFEIPLRVDSWAGFSLEDDVDSNEN
jgi:hypothetical protein